MWMRSQVFLLTEFSRVLFIDSESIAVDNIDHVFMNRIPADHPLEDERLVFTALRQIHCEFHTPCDERRTSSPRFFLIMPTVRFLCALCCNVILTTEIGESRKRG